MQYAELMQAGKLDEALVALRNEVRETPGDVNRWVHLFALECIMGRFEKALGCLQRAASIDEEWAGPAQENRMLIGCELMRREVFGAKKKPLIMGEPPAWIAGYVEAITLDAQGKPLVAAEMRAKAWTDSPSFDAAINGESCESLADADARLGPVLEACLDGGYYWIPFNQIETLSTEPAKVLIELVWLPAKLKLITGAEIKAYLPVRYPGSEDVADADVRLARRTEWRKTPGGAIGLGQKMFEHSAGDCPLLECRSIEFAAAVPQAPSEAAAGQV
jgi:type VI secretion system protein ImpE